MNPNHTQQANIYAGAQVGYNNATNPPVTAAPVCGALIGLDNATVRLHERVSMLEQRLGAVLAPLGPAGVQEASKPARHSLALQIEAGANSINAACDRVDMMISRLEI